MRIFQHTAIVNSKPTSKFETIKFMGAVHMVIAIHNIPLEKHQISYFVSINEVRNSITHFEIDFKNNEVEHILAKFVPILFEIYKNYIDGFDKFNKEYKPDLAINKIIENHEIWASKVIGRYYSKTKKAQQRISQLNKNPAQKNAIFSSKQKNIDYTKCHLCGNDTFIEAGVILIDGEPKINYGNCILYIARWVFQRKKLFIFTIRLKTTIR